MDFYARSSSLLRRTTPRHHSPIPVHYPHSNPPEKFPQSPSVRMVKPPPPLFTKTQLLDHLPLALSHKLRTLHREVSPTSANAAPAVPFGTHPPHRPAAFPETDDLIVGKARGAGAGGGWSGGTPPACWSSMWASGPAMNAYRDADTVGPRRRRSGCVPRNPSRRHD